MSTTPVSFEKYLAGRGVSRETYDALSPAAHQRIWRLRYEAYVVSMSSAREMKIMDAIEKPDHKKTAEIFISNNGGMIIGFIGGITIAAITRVYMPFRHRRWPYTAPQAQWMQQVLLIPLQKPFKTPPRIVLPFVFFGWCSDRGRHMFKRIFNDNN